MSGVLTKKFGRKKSPLRCVVSSRQIFGDLLLGVAPGEVGVGLREADLCQPVHHLRPGEGLGQEDHVGMAAADIGDHPFPERQRLGVRIVDAEDAHALVDPEQHDVAQRQPQPGHRAFGVEIDIDDVLVLLRRILGVTDRAVRRGSGTSRDARCSQGWSGEHWMAKSSAISRPCSRAAADQPAEILRACRAAGWIASCPPSRAADGIGAAEDHPVRASARCCGPCGWSCRSDGSAGNTGRRSPCRGRAAGGRSRRRSAVPRGSPMRRGNSSYQLANSACGRSTSTAISACRQGRWRTSVAATRWCVSAAVSRRTAACCVGTIQLGDELAKAQPAQIGGGIGNVDGDIDTGAALDLDSVAQAAELIAPGFDGVEMPADTLRHHGAAPAVVAKRSHGRAPPLRLAGFAPQQLRRQDVVAVGEDVGLHHDRPADDAANREARRLGGDAIYHHRRAGCRGAGRGRLLAFYRIDSVELSHQYFTWLQAIGHRSSVEQTRFT